MAQKFLTKKFLNSITRGDATLNCNPVLVARDFQYRVEIIFPIVVLDGSLGKTNYYAIRVTFFHLYGF